MTLRNLLVVVDGGGTKTHCVIGNAQGKVLAHGYGGPSNHQVVGLDVAWRSIGQALENALIAAQASLSSVSFGYFGLAGADFPQDQELLGPGIRSIMGTIPFEIVNDAWIVLMGGSPAGWGVALICGTGTNAVARAPNGKTATLRSQNYRLGNYGGGPHLAEMALHFAFRGDEGTGDPTSLQKELPALLGVRTMDDLFMRLFGHPEEPSRQELDRIPPLVFSLAAQGDLVCRRLLTTMGTEIGSMAAAVALRAGLGAVEFPLILSGSLLKNKDCSLLTDAALQRIFSITPGAHPVIPPESPAEGALGEAIRRSALCFS